ncbi:histidine phosphatase family protein [Streptomyces sp. NBC_00572]|uniref:SixA phosphatase family protein n=1 Tax=Streptomyces sp. NBC_00572 TaxID=2903664 RepID=UPI002256B455|nr:histidine phosphatase family protein [Streptomyces sp. NBC_00572]MCX4986029.1 histidine phosphatase family protein [Streptomyces sp. NBC_00572]
MQLSSESPQHIGSAGGRPRRLLVLRHAKSAWPEGVADRDRPLGPRGLRDAPAAGRFLAENGGLPDLVLCSPARRARHTWELAAAELDSPVPTRHDARLYGADGPELLDVLHGVPDEVATLLLVGHNPGLEDLILLLAAEADGAAGTAGTDKDVLDRVRTKFPTSAIAVLTWYGTWTDLRPGEVHLTDLAIPRGVRDSS